MTLECNAFISLAMNGGFKAASSYITHPRDQRSHFEEYGLSSHTSGGQ